jgi:hypothetical protein
MTIYHPAIRTQSLSHNVSQDPHTSIKRLVLTKRKSSEHRTSLQPTSDCPTLSTNISAILSEHLERYPPRPQYWRQSFGSSRSALIPFALIGRRFLLVLRSSVRWLRLLLLFDGCICFEVVLPPSSITVDLQPGLDLIDPGQDQANLELVCCTEDLRIDLLKGLYVR